MSEVKVYDYAEISKVADDADYHGFTYDAEFVLKSDYEAKCKEFEDCKAENVKLEAENKMLKAKFDLCRKQRNKHIVKSMHLGTTEQYYAKLDKELDEVVK